MNGLRDTERDSLRRGMSPVAIRPLFPVACRCGAGEPAQCQWPGYAVNAAAQGFTPLPPHAECLAQVASPVRPHTPAEEGK